MTEQNTTQQERAERFTWGPGDVQITKPKEVAEPQEERVTEPPKAHWRTVKAADMALMKAAISPESHAAVLEGTLSVDEARKIGRDMGPDGPAGQPSKKSTSKKTSKKDAPKNECLCGCGELTASTWKQGHDMRQMGLAGAYIRGEKELSPALVEHMEANGKMQAARNRDEERLAKLDAKQKAEAKKRNSKTIAEVRNSEPEAAG